jgi:hypothetical protein
VVQQTEAFGFSFIALCFARISSVFGKRYCTFTSLHMDGLQRFLVFMERDTGTFTPVIFVR